MVSVVSDKCLLNIGLLILNIIHYLYSVYAFINSVIIDFSLRTRTLCIWLGLFPKQNYYLSSAKYISSLRKIPRHLVIIIGCESVVYNDLVKIVLWCNQLGIKHISFYEQNDDIEPLKLYEAICRQNKENLKIIKWGRSFDLVREKAKRDINGYIWRPELQVDVFRIADGHWLVAELSAALSRSREVTASQVTQPFLEREMSQLIEAPDPDLAIVCGPACSTFGFPPWQLRVTEFQHLQTHHKIKFRNFVSLLHRYSNCEQRFGK
ncbi:dehydrodolichyl diphosphate synthase complex subunit nus1 [Nilaparvata lugens]|uniref:dehydrodolichyl diphosphate synthase complex subunit nus1 n=1 Tax=Nilaparvata lugens TaxID=108931 RepID=UPI00193E96D9|nr:dehydrodolichyl diphosphate synthase complex subunit nus1 [Nilaparvata lugens]